MRRASIRLLPLALIAAMFASATPAAAVTTIAMDSLEDGDVFLPSNPSRPVGATFRWENVDSTGEHTATRGGIVAWDFFVPAGQTSPGKTIKFAGTYDYHCEVHEAMTASLGVRPTIEQNPEEAGSYFLTLGTEAPPGDLVFDVQRKLGNGPWESYRLGVTVKRLKFTPVEVRHSFRARLRRGEAAFTEYSPRAFVDPPA